MCLLDDDIRIDGHTEARVENHIRESSLAKISDVRAKELVSQRLDKILLLKVARYFLPKN